MDCLQVKLQGVTFTDTSLPILRPDSIMSEGSLLLVDFGREQSYPLGTVPTNGALIGNIAWETAAAILAGGDASTLSAVFEDSLAGQPTMGLIERTTKNGLGVIVSQSATDAVNRHGGIALPISLLTYLYNNTPGKSFYVSMWNRLTRLATVGSSANARFSSSFSAPSNGFVFSTPPTTAPSSGGTHLGNRTVPPSNTLGNMFRNVAFSGWVGTKPSLGNSSCVFYNGQRAPYAGGFDNDRAASGIMYRVYIEDLIASGRTYAEVDALDKTLFDAAFGVGGRFYNDVFTAPSTIP